MARTRNAVFRFTASCLLILWAGNAIGEEPAEVARAKKFWKTLATGDTDALKEFYAPQVTLKAGSELLKPQWKLAEDVDRSQDLLVERDDLLRGYNRLIEQVGRKRWTQVFAKIGDEKIRVSTTKADDAPFAGVKRGDTILQVATGPGDDTLIFVFRKDAMRRLLVHLEATDY